MGVGGSKLQHDDGDRVLVAGRPDLNRCDNMITTSKYSVWSFLPIVREIAAIYDNHRHSVAVLESAARSPSALETGCLTML